MQRREKGLFQKRKLARFLKKKDWRVEGKGRAAGEIRTLWLGEKGVFGGGRGGCQKRGLRRPAEALLGASITILGRRLAQEGSYRGVEGKRPDQADLEAPFLVLSRGLQGRVLRGPASHRMGSSERGVEKAGGGTYRWGAECMRG